MSNSSVATILTLIGLMHLVALVSPGPDFAMILRTTVQSGRQAARWSAFGLGLGVLVHVTYCLLGISLLFETAPALMKVIATAGSLYLLYQGYKTLGYAFRTRRQQHPLKRSETTETTQQRSIRSALTQGFVTNLLNPKAVTYFLSFFTAAISNLPSPFWGIVAGLEVFLLTWGWFTFLAHVVSTPRFLKLMASYEFHINLLIGCAFMLFSLSMIVFAYK